MNPKKSEVPLSDFWNTKKGHRVAKRIVVSSAQTLIQDGTIDPRGKTDQQLKEEIVSFYKKFLQSNTEIRIIPDMRTTMLREARRHHANKEKVLSIIIYAVWFEHWINNVIATVVMRKGHNTKSASQMIRDTSIRAKFTWLLELLELPPINKQYTDIIFNLAEYRNSFVHYKWEAKPEQENHKQDREIYELLDKIQHVINYLNKYENKHLYLGGKNRVRKIV